MSKVPVACQNCKKQKPQLSMCRIRKVQFKVFNKPCPREQKPAYPIPLEKPTPQVEDEASFLKSTYEKLGAILPVFRTPSGEVIDGKHRLKVDPGWFSMVLSNINDPVKLAMARLTVNVVRRKVPDAEKTELLTEIARLTKWSPQEIADSLGMSYQWVTKHLPKEYKREYPSETLRVKSLRRRDIQKGVKTETLEKVKKAELKQKPQRVDTGLEFECPVCNRKYMLLHVTYPDETIKHKFEEKKYVH